MDNFIKVWLDDVRPVPKGYVWAHSVNEAKTIIERAERMGAKIELDLDHDLGDFAQYGGDGIKLVLWLAETERYYPIKFHTLNPVGLQNMQAIVDRYWK